MTTSLYKKGLVLAVICLFIGTAAELNIKITTLGENINYNLENLDDTGWHSATAHGYSYNDWLNPENAYVSNNQYSEALGYHQAQDYYNFGFNIPSDADITGIEIKLEGTGDNDYVGKVICRVFHGGFALNETDYLEFPANNDAFHTVGGPDDDWYILDWIWEPEDFENDADMPFFVRLTTGADWHTFRLDNIQAKIYYTTDQNNPPNTPSTPTGPTTGDTNTEYIYYTSATDDDGDNIQYMFDWDAGGSHDYSDWTSLGSSGHTGSMSHSWETGGSYLVKARAKDEHGAESSWSNGLTVNIVGNQPPNCEIQLQKNGEETNIINVDEFFDIYVGDSTDDNGISEVRFSSDDSQDGVPQGEWTGLFDWDISSGDWNANSKIKEWLFETDGYKEVWAEIFDTDGESDKDYANIYASEDDDVIREVLPVPYIHQCWDTNNSFIGSWACAPTSAVMVLAYWLRISPDPFIALQPTPHNSLYGNYVSEIYNFNNFFFTNSVTEDMGNCGIATGEGAWGFIWDQGVGSVSGLLELYLRRHALVVSHDWLPTEQKARAIVKSEIDYGRPLIARTYLTPAGHYAVIVGYEIDSDNNFWYLVNDPFGSSPHYLGTCYGNYNPNDQPIKYSYDQMQLGSSYSRGLILISPSEHGSQYHMGEVFSPVILHAVDEFGRHVGISDEGEIENQIPEAEYSGPDAHPQWIIIHNTSLNFSFYTEGVENGTFDFNLLSSGDENNNIRFLNIKTTGQTKTYLEINNSNILQIDEDGDGAIDTIYGAPIANFSFNPQIILVDETVDFNSNSSFDYDGEIIKYQWYFDDGTYSIEQNPRHIFVQNGIYRVNLTVTDDHGLISTAYKNIIVEKGDSNPPVAPIINGQQSGRINTQYEYYISEFIEPDDDPVYVLWDWGDDSISNWIGPYEPSNEIRDTHSWSEEGNFIIKAKLRDIYGSESDWGTFEVSMPKNKVVNPFLLFLERLIERFPILEQILQLIYVYLG